MCMVLKVAEQVQKKKKVMRKEAIKRRKVGRLKEGDTRARFKGSVGELVSDEAPDCGNVLRKGC